MTLININTALAVLLAVIAFSSLNKMSLSTDCTVRFAIALIFIGALGQAGGELLGKWDRYVDTLLYGGLIALLLANHRRTPTGLGTRWSRPLSFLAAAVTVAIVVGQSIGKS
jgi:hypothetical protein